MRKVSANFTVFFFNSISQGADNIGTADVAAGELLAE